MEQTSSNCRVVVEIDLLHDLLWVGVPQFYGVVDVQGAAEDEAFIGMPANRVDPVNVVRKFPIEGRHWPGLVLPQINDQALIVAHPADNFGLEGR